VLNPPGLQLLAGCGIARNVVLDARAGIVVGEGSLIGFEAVLLSYTHARRSGGSVDSRGSFDGGVVKVGNHAWIGARVFMLPGTAVGDRAVVGACAVVSRVWGEDCRLVGSPAKPH